MLIRHFMARELLTLDPETCCREAWRLLQERRIRRAPVVSKNRAIGIITERDLLRVLPESLAQLEKDELEGPSPRVGDVMGRDLLSVRPNDHLEDAAQLMLDQRVGGLPVLQDGRLVGMVTESDIFRALARRASTGSGTRLTLRWPDRSQPPPDPVPLCDLAGARIRDLSSHAAVGGETMTILHIDSARPDALVESLQDLGYVLMEREDP